MPNRRPSVFIGSSREGLDLAYAIAAELDRVTNPTVWNQNIFDPTYATLEQLESIARTFEYAILVMTPDDDRNSRGEEARIPRDNVVAELGIFLGALGRSRVFFLKPRNTPIALPTDFLGITALEYVDDRHDDNFRAAVGPACMVIKSRISLPSRKFSHDGSSPDVKFWHTVSEREAHSRDVRSMINAAKNRVLITGISLNFVVRQCSRALKECLGRQAIVGLVISKNTEDLHNIYELYSLSVRRNLPTTHAMYSDFISTLDEEQKTRFALFECQSPLTHSIGLYDDEIYISEFCIQHSSSDCPSFSPPIGSPTYSIGIFELIWLLENSTCIFGSAGSALIATLKDGK